MNGMEILNVSAEGINVIVKVQTLLQDGVEALMNAILQLLMQKANQRNADFVYNSHVEVYKKYREGIEKQERYLANFNTEGNVLVGFNGEDGKLLLPSELLVDGEKVYLETIGKGAFQGKDTIDVVVVPESYKAVEESAFDGCTGLTGICFKGGVESIGDSAFSHCVKLETTTFPSALKEIGESAFFQCEALMDIDGFPNTEVEEIGEMAFASCEKLQSISLPQTVKKIGKKAFLNCKSIKEIRVPDNAELGDSAFEGCIDLRRIELGKGCVIGEGVFKNCPNVEELILYKSSGLDVSKLPDDPSIKITYIDSDKSNYRDRPTEGQLNAAYRTCQNNGLDPATEKIDAMSRQELSAWLDDHGVHRKQKKEYSR